MGTPGITPDAPQEPVDGAPEETSTTAQAPDFEALQQATDAHEAAVMTAHANLRTRMESAYAELRLELDRAYTVWEDAAKAAKVIAPAAETAAEEIGNGNTDATTAR